MHVGSIATPLILEGMCRWVVLKVLCETGYTVLLSQQRRETMHPTKMYFTPVRFFEMRDVSRRDSSRSKCKRAYYFVQHVCRAPNKFDGRPCAWHKRVVVAYALVCRGSVWPHYRFKDNVFKLSFFRRTLHRMIVFEDLFLRIYIIDVGTKMKCLNLCLSLHCKVRKVSSSIVFESMPVEKVTKITECKMRTPSKIYMKHIEEFSLIWLIREGRKFFVSFQNPSPIFEPPQTKPHCWGDKSWILAKNLCGRRISCKLWVES